MLYFSFLVNKLAHDKYKMDRLITSLKINIENHKGTLGWKAGHNKFLVKFDFRCNTISCILV